MDDKVIQSHDDWFKKSYPATYRDAKEGRDFDAICHFDHSLAGWQSALDSVVVDLPWSNDCDLMEQIEECRDAIHAAGVKTK